MILIFNLIEFLTGNFVAFLTHTFEQFGVTDAIIMCAPKIQCRQEISLDLHNYVAHNKNTTKYNKINKMYTS